MWFLDLLTFIVFVEPHWITLQGNTIFFEKLCIKRLVLSDLVLFLGLICTILSNKTNSLVLSGTHHSALEQHLNTYKSLRDWFNTCRHREIMENISN